MKTCNNCNKEIKHGIIIDGPVFKNGLVYKKIKHMKIDTNLFKELEYKFKVDVSGIEKENYHLVFPKSYWMADNLFKWTEEEIDNADNGFIGTKYGTDCYVTRNLTAVSK